MVALAVAALFLPGSPASNAAADGPIVIRYASLAPPSSAFGKILKAWGRTFKKETEGRAELRFYTGGSQGDERDFIRKIRAGQIDAAGITTTGMGMVVRPILVLTAPGLITEMEQLYHVRTALRRSLRRDVPRCGVRAADLGRRRQEPPLLGEPLCTAQRPQERAAVGLER